MAVLLQEIIDAITSGTRSEKEVLAGLVIQADQFLQNTTAATAAAARTAGLAVADTWFTANVQPLLVWNNSQQLPDQRANIITDYRLIEGLIATETDPFRLEFMRSKLAQGEAKFKQIKAQLVP